jgi:hypothetical protein
MNLMGTALVVLTLAGCTPPDRLKPGLQTNGGSWKGSGPGQAGSIQSGLV